MANVYSIHGILQRDSVLKCFFLGFGRLLVLVETDLGNDEQNMLDLTNW